MAAEPERTPAGEDVPPPPARGRVLVELLTSLDHEMQQVARKFPSAGPPACALPPPVTELCGELELVSGPDAVALVGMWLRQRRRFDEATDALEALDHRARVLCEEERRELSLRHHEVRDARRRLNELASELRAAMAREIDAADEAAVGQPHTSTNR